eukprot:395040-Rhodomonas_salina.5
MSLWSIWYHDSFASVLLGSDGTCRGWGPTRSFSISIPIPTRSSGRIGTARAWYHKTRISAPASRSSALGLIGD